MMRMRYKLEDLFDLQMGKTPARNNPEYWNSTDNKWISIGDLSKCGKYITNTKEYLSDTAVEESGISVIPERTVVMSFKLSIGKTAITSEPMYSNEAIMAFRDKHLVPILPDYLYYMFLAKDWDEGTNKAVMGKTLNKATLAKITIDVHSLAEQKKIVDALDKVASIIDTRQKQLSALDDLIKARFVEMFGDCRDTTSAGDLMYTLRNGVSPSTSGRHHEKVLTLSAITQGQFDPDMWKDGMFDSIPTADKRICSTDFYMCRGNGNKSLVGAGVYSAEDRDDLVFPDTVIAASIDTTRVCLPYLFVAWMQPRIREQIENGARTTNGTYKINQQIISKIKVPLPPICEQLKFGAFVTQIDKSKFAIQKSLNETPLLYLTA